MAICASRPCSPVEGEASRIQKALRIFGTLANQLSVKG
jgi:hypothetical protein